LIFFVLAHSVDLLFNPSLLDIVFYNFTRWLSLRFSFRSTFPQNSQAGMSLNIALLLFKAGDWHQTLFFPALVSNRSFLHEEGLSE
jgi:hypothetical protein